MIHLTIDGKPIAVPENRSILEACREYGIYIPTLCYHPALEPYGACRLCVVEVQLSNRPARLVAACTHPCQEGIQVSTNSEMVQRSRRITAELLLAVAYDSPQIVALARELGVEQVRYKLPDADECVLCGLCVRACQEIVGVRAISFIRRGMSKKVSTPFEISSSTCIGCGTCVLICPTGKIHLSDISGMRDTHRSGSEFNRLYCQVCGDVKEDMQSIFIGET